MRICIPRFPLQQGASGDKVTLHPVILPDVFESFKNQVKMVIKRESRGPEHHLQTYNKYDFLISRQVIAIIQFKILYAGTMLDGPFILV